MYDRTYAKQAQRDLVRLFVFLYPPVSANLMDPVDLDAWKMRVRAVTPEDIVEFLIDRDVNGANRTQVHDLSCAFLGLPGIRDCGCRVGMAASSVDSLVGRLARGFNIWRRSGPCDYTNVGNPTNSFVVKEYVKFLEFEQANALVRPRQATPVFAHHLRALMLYLARLVSEERDPVRGCILRMDSAFFALVFARGKRPGDAIQLDGRMTFWLPEEAGLLFNVMVGKTLRHGFQDVFTLLRADSHVDFALDPVPLLVEYARFSRSALSIEVNLGPLFRNHSWRDRRPSASRLIAATVNARFIRYLKDAGIFRDGVTLYGLRSGQGLATLFEGASFEDMMLKIGWRTRRTAEHYMRLHRVFKEIYDTESVSPDILAERFAQLDMHTDLRLAF
jgi:hypothetical protein